MSQDKASQFLAKMDKDGMMKAAVDKEIAGKSGDARNATLVTLGARYGFVFTAADVAAASSGALADDALDSVQGGSEADSCLPPGSGGTATGGGRGGAEGNMPGGGR